MAYKFTPQSDHQTRTEYQCKNPECHSWLNKAGYMDDAHRTSKGVYCQFCKTATQRKEMDNQNKEIENERNKTNKL